MSRGEAGERGVQRKGTRVACHGPMMSPEGKNQVVAGDGPVMGR